MGKKKIDIKKIGNKNYLKATFSKRRKGLFRKATDLCCLTGAQVAIITFSPGNKPFLFGNPSAENVIERFLNEQASCTTDEVDEVHEEGVGSDEHDDFEAIKEEEFEESDEDDDGMDEDDGNFWWSEAIDDEELEVDELKNYREVLQGLKDNVASKLDEMNMREFYTKNYLGM